MKAEYLMGNNIPASSFALRGAMICLHQMHDFMPYIGPDINALCGMVLDDCAESGFNALLVEYEAMYPYRGEHARISCADAYSKEDIARFNSEAKRRGVAVIPLVQSLGHVYHILIHDEYRHLREVPDQLQQFCPSHSGALTLMKELIDDVIDSHPESVYIHLGGDECRLLGRCERCRTLAARNSAGAFQLYADYYIELTRHVLGRGKIPILWHDIAVKHPELLSGFDDRVVFHFWNYGDHCHGRLEEKFDELAARIPPSRIIGGAAIRCEAGHGSLLPSPELTGDNIDRMNAVIGRSGALGSIVTDWPDSGMSWMLSPLFWRRQGGCAGADNSFASEYFGLDLPEWFDKLDALYGAVPFAAGFQTELIHYLNRYAFASFDLEKLLKRTTDRLGLSPGLGEFYWLCHRRKLLRRWLEKLLPLSGNVTRHRTEFQAWLLTFRAMELLLTLSIGHIVRKWDESGELMVGYQLTPSLAREDLAGAGRRLAELSADYRKFYSGYSAPRQVENFVKMLLKPEYVRETDQ